VSPVPVVGFTDKVYARQGFFTTLDSDHLTVTTDKEYFTTREKVTLKVKTTDGQGDAIAAHLAVSVTDAQQVVPIPVPRSIKTSWAFEDINITGVFAHPIEYGVTLKGSYQEKPNKPATGLLDIIQFDPHATYLTELDSSGAFELRGLLFYGSKNLFVKKVNSRLPVPGKAALISREIPAIDHPDENIVLAIEHTQFPQRIISDYEVPRDAIVLKEVEIKSSKIEDDAFDRYAKSYGRADYVLDGSKLNKSYGNLLYTLPGKFPGLVVREVNARAIDDPNGNTWAIYTTRWSGGTSIGFPPSPMIMINNVAMVGDAANILSSIDPNTVERIELTVRINSMHGVRGVGGVLNIITKIGADFEEAEIPPNFTVVSANGFDQPRPFRAPDHSEPQEATDYRSTLLWQPKLKVTREGYAELDFYTSDLPGMYRIHIVGVLEDGTPVESVQFITVK